MNLSRDMSTNVQGLTARIQCLKSLLRQAKERLLTIPAPHSSGLLELLENIDKALNVNDASGPSLAANGNLVPSSVVEDLRVALRRVYDHERRLRVREFCFGLGKGTN